VSKPDDPDALKAKLMILRRKNIEIDLAVSRGQLVPRERVQRSWNRRSTECRVLLEGVPTLAAELIADDSEERAKVYAAAERIVLERLFRAAGKPEEFERWLAHRNEGKATAHG
jgi:hypothetical protein